MQTANIYWIVLICSKQYRNSFDYQLNVQFCLTLRWFFHCQDYFRRKSYQIRFKKKHLRHSPKLSQVIVLLVSTHGQCILNEMRTNLPGQKVIVNYNFPKTPNLCDSLVTHQVKLQDAVLLFMALVPYTFFVV